MERTPDTLSENPTVRQRPEEGFRRWFVNSYFDVILWYESARGALTGFQLCYNRGADERAFTWYRDKRSSHYVSSGGEPVRGGGTTRRMATAVLHGNAGAVPREILERLERERGDLDPGTLAMIIREAERFNREHHPS